MYPNNHDDWISGAHHDDWNLGGEPDPAVEKARETLRNRPAPRHSDDAKPSSVMPGSAGRTFIATCGDLEVEVSAPDEDSARVAAVMAFREMDQRWWTRGPVQLKEYGGE
jgi:hypothetical protein